MTSLEGDTTADRSIETPLLHHPNVADVAIVHTAEGFRALIVLGPEGSAEQILSWLSRSESALGRHRLAKHLEFRRTLPARRSLAA